jgi:subtilisin family serine protease
LLKTSSRFLALAASAALSSGCSGGGSSSTPQAGPTATPAPESAYTCPSSDVPSSTSRSALALRTAGGRKPAGGARAAAVTPGRVEVTYDLPTLSNARTSFAARESSLGASLVHEFDFTHLGVATRVLNVSPAQASAVAAKLRAQAGVRSVTVGSGRRYAQTVSGPYFTNDPYFVGFQTTLVPSGGTTPSPVTYEVPPYEQNAGVPGQWNMHAIGLQNAFAYSRANNGSNVSNPNSIGSSAVKIAIIDVGEDATHPELASKIAYQRCYLTDPSGVQNSSNFTTDEIGHGTDVAGIAAAVTNNALGFAGAGGNSTIYAYRTEPTPDDDCAKQSPTDAQCGIDTTDIASAVEDAVANKVNVINLSVGGGTCSNGHDQDPTEGNAIADAIAANIIVVAAAGNDKREGVEAPACDPGVIAAGATSLADGQPNGSSTTKGSAASPVEYVASYSDYGSPGASVKSATAWGIVAPGGDPINDNDADDLHWITDIWTSTPLDASFAEYCGPDYPGTGSQVVDCQTEIAGTSMASPTVAGAAALILAVASGYQSPTRMKSLLCSTADDIGDSKEGCGRLDVYRAMAVALGDSSPP